MLTTTRVKSCMAVARTPVGGGAGLPRQRRARALLTLMSRKTWRKSAWTICAVFQMT